MDSLLGWPSAGGNHRHTKLRLPASVRPRLKAQAIRSTFGIPRTFLVTLPNRHLIMYRSVRRWISDAYGQQPKVQRADLRRTSNAVDRLRPVLEMSYWT
jgi:hypothetical protein